MTFAQWRWSEEGFDRDFVASELAKNIEPLEAGVLRYGGSAFFGDPLTLLETGVDFLVPLADEDRSKIIRSALGRV